MCDPDDDHAPAFVVDRVGPVDLERDATILRGVQLGAGIRPEDDSAPRERIVDREDQGLVVDDDRQAPEVMLGEQPYALVDTDRLETGAHLSHGNDGTMRRPVISSGCSRT